MENVLIYQVGNAFFDLNTTIPAAQLTINKVGTVFVRAVSGTLYLANSLLVEATNTSGKAYTSVNNASSDSSAAVFQTVGGASHYLADNSPYRGVGIANIDSAALLADLATKTTHPPNTSYVNQTISGTFNP